MRHELHSFLFSKGGGRPDFAQAGGNDPSKLDQALNSVPDWVAEKLS